MYILIVIGTVASDSDLDRIVSPEWANGPIGTKLEY